MMKALKLILLALVMSVSFGCAAAISSIDPIGPKTFIMTGQVQIPFSGLKGFVWEGEYDPDTKSMKIRKKAIAPW